MTTDAPNPAASPGVLTERPIVESRPSLRRELFHATLASGTYVAADALTRGITLVLTLVYTRYLSPADYATLAIATTIAVFAGPIIGLSVTSAISRLYFEAHTEEERRRLYGTVLAVLLVVPTALMVAIEIVGRTTGVLNVFAAAPYSPYLRYALLAAYFNLFLEIPLAIYAVQRKARKVLALAVLNAFLMLGTSLTLVVGMGEGVLGVLRAAMLSAAAMAVLSIVLTLRSAGMTLRFSWPMLVSAVGFSAPLIPHAVAQWMLQLSDRPVLAHYVDSAALGNYYIGYSVGAAAGLLVHGATRAMGPVVTRDLKLSLDHRVVRFGTYWFGALVAGCLAVALIGRDALALVVGTRYADAPKIVPIVAAAYAAFAAYAIVTQGIWFAMRTRWVPVLTLVGGAANIALNLVLVPRYGILAAAWDTVAGFAILAVLQGLLAHRLYRIDWEYLRWLKLIIAGVAAYAVARSVGVHLSVLRFALDAAAVCLVMPVALTLLMFWSDAERQLIRGRLRPRG
jgi:O-antigen/teichoic acid export membrane protein